MKLTKDVLIRDLSKSKKKVIIIIGSIFTIMELLVILVRISMKDTNNIYLAFIMLALTIILFILALIMNYKSYQLIKKSFDDNTFAIMEDVVYDKKVVRAVGEDDLDQYFLKCKRYNQICVTYKEYQRIGVGDRIYAVGIYNSKLGKPKSCNPELHGIYPCIGTDLTDELKQYLHPFGN